MPVLSNARTADAAVQPHYVSVAGWLALSGMTRTGTYLALGRGDLRAIKQPGGRRTLIDVQHGLAWLAADHRRARHGQQRQRDTRRPGG
jgi:hypothetical protein